MSKVMDIPTDVKKNKIVDCDEAFNSEEVSES